MSEARVEMVHVRSFVFHSLSGHSIRFEGPNKPVMVPPTAVRECMSIGAAPTSEVNMPDHSGVKKDRLELAAEAPMGGEREAQVIQAMKDLIGVNDPDSFDANGSPRMRALNAILPFRVTADERNLLWPMVKKDMATTV